MEPKTCEEYVLEELKAAQAKIEQLQDEKTRAMNEFRSELIKVTSVKDYANKVIELLKGWIVLVPKDGNKDGFELQAMGHITLNLKSQEGLQQFILLAPLFGDDAAREELQKLAEKKPAATEEEKAAPEDKEDTENKED